MAQNLYKNLFSFEQNGIQKQNEAYKLGFAKKNFEYSCKLCCEQNKRRGTCTECPIRLAHKKAMAEIQSGLREKPYNGNCRDSRVERDTVSVKGNIHITLTIHFG